MPTINMRSAALSVKGQGVGSCYSEQVRLVSEGLKGKYKIYVNSPKRCDITHYHTVNVNYFFDRLLTRSRTAGIGYVHFLPDTVDDSLRMPKICRAVFYKYLLAFYNSMDYLVVVNPVIIKKLSAYGVKKPKIVYIPNYVANDDFYPLNADKRGEARQKLGYSDKDFVVMGAGQLQTRKGVFDFAETARRLPDVKFMWAGGFSFGMFTDGYEDIKAMMEAPPGNVKFLGMIERENMVDLYNAADLFFLPSFDELFPMTILEAAACGTPILLRDLELYKGILSDYYKAGADVDSFAEIIDRLRDDRASLAALAGKARQCHEAYSEETILKMWAKLYGEARALRQNSALAAEGLYK